MLDDVSGMIHERPVAQSNLPGRSMLVVLLTVAASGVVVIEQPGSSVLEAHDAFKRVMQLLRQQKIAAT